MKTYHIDFVDRYYVLAWSSGTQLGGMNDVKMTTCDKKQITEFIDENDFEFCQVLDRFTGDVSYYS